MDGFWQKGHLKKHSRKENFNKINTWESVILRNIYKKIDKYIKFPIIFKILPKFYCIVSNFL